MFKKSLSIVLGGFLFLLLVSLAWAAGRDFSADVVTTSSQGTMTSKMYFKGLKIRTEANIEGRTSISILRNDKKVMWMLMPQEKMYMETPIQNLEISSRVQDSETKMEKKFIANETVEGHPCKKYYVTLFGTDGKKVGSGYLWEATDLKITIKWQDEENKVTVVWKNIKFGSIPDSLFEVPPGYQKMGMPGGFSIPGM